MKKLILAFFTMLAIYSANGQSQPSVNNENNTLKLSGLSLMDQNPTVFIVVDSSRIKIEDFKKYDLKSEWIESVDVLKDDISKTVYGNKNGAIIIYIKKNYGKRVMKEIKKNNDA